MHKGRVCRLGLRLSADGGLLLLAIASARIWWIAKMEHRLVAVGLSALRSRWGMASSCCRPSRWNLHVAVQSLVCGQRPPSEAVEGMAWVPGASCPRHDGR